VDSDGVNLVLVGPDPAQPGDAGIPDQPAFDARGFIVIVFSGELGQKRPLWPRIVAVEQLGFQFRTPCRITGL
jgi:hypothetical protein